MQTILTALDNSQEHVPLHGLGSIGSAVEHSLPGFRWLRSPESEVTHGGLGVRNALEGKVRLLVVDRLPLESAHLSVLGVQNHCVTRGEPVLLHLVANQPE